MASFRKLVEKRQVIPFGMPTFERREAIVAGVLYLGDMGVNPVLVFQDRITLASELRNADNDSVFILEPPDCPV